MNLSSGYPLDLIRNGLPNDYPRLLRDRKIDVVVMGGGISGALAAYFLHRAGIDCLLVDARTIGLGSTCASTSLLQYEIDRPLHQLALQIGDEKATRAYHRSAAAIGTLEEICKEIGFADFKHRKSVYFAADRKGCRMLEREYESRLLAGFDVEWADRSELDRRYGLMAPGAIVSSLAAQTNAYCLTHALHRHNSKRGVEVYDRTPVVHIDHRRSGVTLVTADGYQVRCRKLVYATGYESVRYIGKGIVKLAATYALASEQFDNDRFLTGDDAIFWNTSQPYLYSRITDDRRVVVGGRDEGFLSDKKRDALIETKSRQLCRDFTRCFPGIPLKKEFAWTGIFGSTRDGLPYIGSYNKLPHGLFALGFGGNGVTFSVMAGEMIAGAVLGKTDPDAGLFSFGR